MRCVRSLSLARRPSVELPELRRQLHKDVGGLGERRGHAGVEGRGLEAKHLVRRTADDLQDPGQIVGIWCSFTTAPSIDGAIAAFGL